MSEDEKLLKEAKKLPWEDRLLHKNWKVRNDANIDLASLCDSITDPKDPRIRELGLIHFLGFFSFSHFFLFLDLTSVSFNLDPFYVSSLLFD